MVTSNGRLLPGDGSISGFPKTRTPEAGNEGADPLVLSTSHTDPERRSGAECRGSPPNGSPGGRSSREMAPERQVSSESKLERSPQCLLSYAAIVRSIPVLTVIPTAPGVSIEDDPGIDSRWRRSGWGRFPTSGPEESVPTFRDRRSFASWCCDQRRPITPPPMPLDPTPEKTRP